MGSRAEIGCTGRRGNAFLLKCAHIPVFIFYLYTNGVFVVCCLLPYIQSSRGWGDGSGGKHLLCKQEDMDLDPQDTHKKLGASSHIGRPSTRGSG